MIELAVAATSWQYIFYGKQTQVWPSIYDNFFHFGISMPVVISRTTTSTGMCSLSSPEEMFLTVTVIKNHLLPWQYIFYGKQTQAIYDNFFHFGISMPGN